LTTRLVRRYNISPDIKIIRNTGSGTHSFNDIFIGFEKLGAVKGIFGKETNKMLSELRVEVFPRQGYMGVSDEDGHIFASQYYIRNGELWSIYLDTIHELVHVKQFMEGKNLFDPAYSYVDRPTEIEAYQVGAIEARRIGLSEKEIFDYLEVPWITKTEHIRLARACGLTMNQESHLANGNGKKGTKKSQNK
jgi:hypothetical protein